jgi:NAD(P)H dehydrogenase (quinone)
VGFSLFHPFIQYLLEFGADAALSHSTLTHHGVLYIPLGYAHAFKQLTGSGEVHGGSPWGAGTFAAADGSRQPTTLELEVARIQGKTFYGVVNRVKF